LRNLIVIRDRTITDSDIELIRSLVDKNRHKSRCYISKLLAREWQWYQPNGRLKDRACRDILAFLERQGSITLPPLQERRKQIKNDCQQLKINFDFNPIAIEGKLNEFLPLSFKMVCQEPLEALWNQIIADYHYLGYSNIVGSHLKYLVYTACGQVVAALGWGSAVWKLKPRDKAIGWTVQQRKEHLHKVANNYRFLILPGVKIPCLASHILSQNIRMINDDWYQRYNYSLSILETFVDSSQFKGTCYRAANWIYVGQTKGFAKKGNSFHYHGQPKEVFLYPLSHQFRKELGVNNSILPPLRHPAMRDYLSLNEPNKPKRGGNMIIHHEGWNRQLPPPLDLKEHDIEQLSQEFEQFHRLFNKAFYRVEQLNLSRCYLQGLMSPLERKSVEPIALSLMNTKRVRALQLFMGSGKWQTETLDTLHKQEAAKTLAHEDGVLSVDSSEFAKKGKESVGVARQYCGRLGKVENCQSGVFLAYSSPKGYGLIDRRLFLPKLWFSEEYQQRWQKCKIPPGTAFKTKITLALEMVQELQKNGLFPGKWIACDEFFGRASYFLDNLPKELLYFAEVPRNTRVWLEQPVVEIPAYSGRGRKPEKAQCLSKPITVSELSKNNSLIWHRVTLAEGAKGPIVAKVTRVPVFECRNGLPGKQVWLFIRCSMDHNEIKYFLSNAPMDTSFDNMCHVCMMRWPIEQCFQEGKSELGMDHYEHRSWQAWHRHMTFVFIAQLFLLRVRHMFKKNSGIDTIASHTVDDNDLAQ
jgi:SRSO17 transposase